MIIGQTAEEYEASRGDEEEIWIKGFRDGMTRIRLLPTPTKYWITYREHYDEGVGFFPCSQERDCVGCTDTSAKTRQRTRRYAVLALDETGRLNIYKMGVRLYRMLQGREQRLSTVSDRDYTVIRSGSKLETSYDLDPGDVYEVEFPTGDELYDVRSVLTEKYIQTVAAYNGEDAEPTHDEPVRDTEPGEWSMPTGPQDAPPAKKTATKKAALAHESPVPNIPRDEQPAPAARIKPRATAAPSTPEPEAPAAPPRIQRAVKAAPPAAPAPAATNGHGTVGWGPNPSTDDIDAADTGVIKEWLTSMEAEFPVRAPRSRLVTIAKEQAAKPPY